MKKLLTYFTQEKLIKIINILLIVSILLDFHIFYSNIATLIRVILISIIFFVILIKLGTKKDRKLLIGYFGITLIYIILHICNTLSFNIGFNVNYSVLEEMLYFVKMTMNVFVIYIIYKLNYNIGNLEKVVKMSIVLIAGSIIIANIFEIGYTSYDFTRLKYSIFDWNAGHSYMEISSKGFFHLTNQIAAILTMYMTLMLIYFKEKTSLSNFIYILITITAMLMLGTRISSYLPLIILILSIVVYLIFILIKIEKNNIKFFVSTMVLCLIWAGIYVSSPIILRNEYYELIFKEHSNRVLTKKEQKLIQTPRNELTIDEFKELLGLYYIDSDFYSNYYLVENDREFYENYISLETSKKNDTRFLEEAVIKRVKELNNNRWDNWFGIGYERIMNIFNIEKDYVMQYYALGIIGLILILGINVIILAYAYLKILFNLKKLFTFKNVFILISVTFFLAAAYFSGNILNSLSCIIPVSVVIGVMLNELKIQKNNSECENYLGLKVSSLDQDEILSRIFKNKCIVFNINPLICFRLRKNNKYQDFMNKQKYNIPDGNGIVLFSKLKGGNIKKAIPGIELMLDICEKSQKKGLRIYLYGAKKEIVKEAKSKLESKYTKINIVGYSDGYSDSDYVLENIAKCHPDILFVALGTPRQEKFIIDNYNKLKNIKIIMPVGGSFDVISGYKLRAPKVFRKLKLEWLYRIFSDPKRFKQLFEIIGYIILMMFHDINVDKNSNY